MSSDDWMIRHDEEGVVHEAKLGVGGFGEVHKVCSPQSCLVLIANIYTFS